MSSKSKHHSIRSLNHILYSQDWVDFGQITKQSGTNTEVILNRLIERYRAKLYQIGVDKEVEYRIFWEKLNLELKSKITKLRDDYNSNIFNSNAYLNFNMVPLNRLSNEQQERNRKKDFWV